MIRPASGCARMIAALALFAAAVPARAAVAPYHPPSPVVRTLPNGLTIAVFADHRLPIVQAALLVPAGSTQESAREVGVGSLTAATLVRGTASRTADDFDAELHRHGATLGANAGREYAIVTLGLPARDFEPALELFADAVLNPAFSDEEIQAARTRLLQQIASGRQNAGTIADEHAIALGFAGAAGSPVAGTFETLTELNRAEVQAFHRRCYRPGRAVLGVAGDVEPERVFALAQRLFGSWSGSSTPPAAAALASGAGPRVRIVDLPGRTQSEFRVVLPAPARADTQRAAAAQILSALLESRRDARGRVLPRDERATVTALGGAGLLVVSGNAPADSVASRIRSVRAALTDLAGRPVDTAMLDAARRRMSGAYALPFETLSGVLGQWLAARAAGLGDGEPARFGDRLAAVDAAAVTQVASMAADAKDPVIVVAGPANRLASSLATLGTVEVVSATASAVAVPAAPSRTTSAPTAEQVASGRRMIGDAVSRRHARVRRPRSERNAQGDPQGPGPVPRLDAGAGESRPAGTPGLARLGIRLGDGRHRAAGRQRDSRRSPGGAPVRHRARAADRFGPGHPGGGPRARESGVRPVQ